MFKLDKTDIQRIAVSSVGAIALSAASVLAATAPAKAEAPASAAAWSAKAGTQLSGPQASHLGDQDKAQVGSVQLAAHFTADGDFAGAQIVKSSGNRAIDRDALRVANRTAYPALPATLKGTPQTVAVKLYFAATDRDVARAIAADEARVRYARNEAGSAGGKQIAAR